MANDADLDALEKEIASVGTSTPQAAGPAASPAAASSKSALPQKSLKGRLSFQWLGRLRLKGRGADFAEIWRGLYSQDPSVRRMSLLFFLSLAGVCVVMVLGFQYYQQLHRKNVADQSAQQLGEFLRKQAEEAKHKASQVAIGSFYIEIKKHPDAPARTPPGVSHLAEIELVLDCDEKGTRDYIEAHQPQVRNELTNVFLATDREELMSRDGKKRLKKAVMDRMNQWLPKGTVKDVYITKLTIS